MSPLEEFPGSCDFEQGTWLVPVLCERDELWALAQRVFGNLEFAGWRFGLRRLRRESDLRALLGDRRELAMVMLCAPQDRNLGGSVRGELLIELLAEGVWPVVARMDPCSLDDLGHDGSGDAVVAMVAALRQQVLEVMQELLELRTGAHSSGSRPRILYLQTALGAYTGG